MFLLLLAAQLGGLTIFVTVWGLYGFVWALLAAPFGGTLLAAFAAMLLHLRRHATQATASVPEAELREALDAVQRAAELERTSGAARRDLTGDASDRG